MSNTPRNHRSPPINFDLARILSRIHPKTQQPQITVAPHTPAAALNHPNGPTSSLTTPDNAESKTQKPDQPASQASPSGNGHACITGSASESIASEIGRGDNSKNADPVKNLRAPRVFNENAQNSYCELLRRGLSKTDAARLIGIARQTVSRARRDPEFDRRVRQAILDCHSRAAAQIARAGDSNWRAAAWVLSGASQKRSLIRPRDLRPLLFDKRCRAELKNVVREVLSELLPHNPVDKTPSPSTTPRESAAIPMHDLRRERQQAVAKLANQVTTLALGASAANGHARGTNGCAQNVNPPPKTPSAEMTKPVTPTEDAPTVLQPPLAPT